MDHKVRFVLIAFVTTNAFAAFVASRWYTAWGIRVRNEAYYFLLRRPVNRDKADRAEEYADRYLVWIRPLAFVLANVAAALIAWRVYSE
jgi:hypothetical protein